MNISRETLITELRDFENELLNDLTTIQTAIKILVSRMNKNVDQGTMVIKLPEKKCVQCGVMFQPSHNRTILCSAKCRSDYTLKKKSDLKQKTSVRRLRENQPIPNPLTIKSKKMNETDQWCHDIATKSSVENLKD